MISCALPAISGERACHICIIQVDDRLSDWFPYLDAFLCLLPASEVVVYPGSGNVGINHITRNWMPILGLNSTLCLLGLHGEPDKVVKKRNHWGIRSLNNSSVLLQWLHTGWSEMWFGRALTAVINSCTNSGCCCFSTAFYPLSFQKLVRSGVASVAWIPVSFLQQSSQWKKKTVSDSLLSTWHFQLEILLLFLFICIELHHSSCSLSFVSFSTDMMLNSHSNYLLLWTYFDISRVYPVVNNWLIFPLEW